MNTLKFVFILFVLYRVSFVILSTPGPQNNGEGSYVVRQKWARLCRGPKAKNLTNVFLSYKKKGGHSYAVLNVTALSTVKIAQVKITRKQVVHRNKSLEYVPILEYKTSKPCSEFLLKSVITLFINQSCVIQKGTTFTAGLDQDLMFRLVYGQLLTYGAYTNKFVALAAGGNLCCYEDEIDISPIN